MSARVRVHGLSVTFGDVVALRSIDLAVAPGEVVAVLGPSGSGKSTLLRAIAGLQPPAAGEISINGVTLAGVPPHKRGVGLMFQDHALFPHRDVAGNIAFGLRMLRQGRAEISARVEEMLELVGLSGFGSRGVQTLSGGEQQRVALARALAPRPSVLLLDEPLGALDRPLREHLVGELRGLFAELDLTVIAVTHDHAEAFSLADRVSVMDDGAILQSGAPRSVWAEPRSRRVAELLGFANLLDAVALRGVASTRWGTVPAAAPDGPVTLLLRPSAVTLRDAHEGHRARVLSTTFAGDRTIVVVGDSDAPPLEALVATGAAPRLGDEVGVVLDPAEIAVLRS